MIIGVDGHGEATASTPGAVHGARAMTAPAQLDAAYRAAAYVVAVPREPTLTLRIGERSQRLARLLVRHGVRDWAFVTAYNPRNRRRSTGRNAQALRVLRGALRGRSLLLSADGRADDSSWCEASVFAAPMTAARAMRLGRQFQQYAVVVGRRGGPARLAWCIDRLIA